MTANKIPQAISSLDLTRRQFLARAGVASAALSQMPSILGAEAQKKINVGLIGCGGRGSWIADLFQKHGGFNLVAVADYFQDKVDIAGEKLQIPRNKRFTGLNGYKKMLDESLDAVIIQSPPYFHPEQAAMAVAAGKHVYLAKPIAVDVPGCQTIRQSGMLAKEKQKCFFVDFQTRAHPAYQEVVKRVQNGEIGQLVSAEATYMCSVMFNTMDAQYRKTKQQTEDRLRAWAIDRVISGDVITEQNIHALDVASWFLNSEPVKAYGSGGRSRPFLGDCWDHYAVIYYFPGDVLVSFSAKQVGFGYDDIMCRVYGSEGTADTHYAGKVWMRSKEDAFNGDTPNLYADGTIRNIKSFHHCISTGDFSNGTVAPSVRSNLTTILGRMAAYKNGMVTWKEMMQANEKWELDIQSLKS